MPLERDEGEYAYIGQLMLQGVLPYKMAYVVKLPGPAAVYALSMALFGQTVTAIHLSFLLGNVAAIVLLFFLTKKWFGAGAGLIAAGAYAVMSLSWGVYGNAAHATQFIVPVALGGILVLLGSFESGSVLALFWSGLLFGLAFVLKQPGLLFGLYGGVLVLTNELKLRPIDWTRCFKRTAIFCLGVILPFLLLCLILWRAGLFGRFWFWSFTVAGGGWVSMRQGWADFLWYIHWARMSGQLPLWLLAAAISPFVFWMRAVQPIRLSFLAFCAVSILGGAAGLRFNPHYLVVTLPAVGMIIGVGVSEATRILRKSRFPAFAFALPFVLFCIDCGNAVISERDYLFTATPDQIIEKIYPTQPFREAAQVADYIRRNSTPDARIAVLGSEPEICFLARRRSATGHLSTYILMDERPYSHDMQEEMIREIKAAQPEYIVYVENVLSWFPPPKPDYTLLESMMQYVKTDYHRVAVVVTPKSGPPTYYWDAAAQKPPPDPQPRPSHIFVFKKK